MTVNNGTTPQRAQVAPRGHENDGGLPTVAPERARSAPRHTPPVAPDPEKSLEQHWRKHPSDYHADCAVGAMGRAAVAVDSAQRDYEIKVADINSRLSLRDAVLEHAAVMRDIRDGKSLRTNNG